jgi:hypothetical protein
VSSRKNLRWWVLAMGLWPILILTVGFIWPGPDKQQALQQYFIKPAYDAVSPPVDTTGARGELTVSDAQGSARIFWTQPKPGKVKLTIEVPSDIAVPNAPVTSRPK